MSPILTEEGVKGGPLQTALSLFVIKLDVPKIFEALTFNVIKSPGKRNRGES